MRTEASIEASSIRTSRARKGNLLEIEKERGHCQIQFLDDDVREGQLQPHPSKTL